MNTMLTEQQLNALAQQAAMETEFPPETRPMPVRVPPTPEEEAAYAAHIRGGYYVPGVGAFDHDEGWDGSPHAVLSPNSKPFHIGQSYGKSVAQMIACSYCGGTAFEVGVSDFFTALRCLGCQREWSQHEG